MPIRSLKFTKQQAQRAKDKLNEAQNALSQFRAKHKISDLSSQVAQLLQQRTDVESRLTIAQSKVAAAQQKQKVLTSLLKEIPPLIKTTAQGETYRGIDTVQSQLDTLEAKRQKLAATYRPGSPVFRSAGCGNRRAGKVGPQGTLRGTQAATARNRTWCTRTSRPTCCAQRPRPPAPSSRPTCWASSWTRSISNSPT